MSDEGEAEDLGGVAATPAPVPAQMPASREPTREERLRAAKVEAVARLAYPFMDHEVRVRKQGGREFRYVTARTVMNRLDDVLGPWAWEDRYTRVGNAWLCRLTLTFPDGTEVSKEDVGGDSPTPDSSDVEKSGVSDAFKRAAVKFGIGRYLYDDGVPEWIAKKWAKVEREMQGGGR